MEQQAPTADVVAGGQVQVSRVVSLPPRLDRLLSLVPAGGSAARLAA